MPDLLEATREYWRKLDQLEAAYYRGEISQERVDAEVKKLMAELGSSRREAFRIVWQSIRYRLENQTELVTGLVIIAICFSGWILTAS